MIFLEMVSDFPEDLSGIDYFGARLFDVDGGSVTTSIRFALTSIDFISELLEFESEQEKSTAKRERVKKFFMLEDLKKSIKNGA